jgi:CheY-like chemotaxis protein
MIGVDLPTELRPLVLYVEDEPAVLELGVTALGDAGFGVEAAHTGAEAIAHLEARHKRFSALVTDINLAAGADGWEVARRARELFPDIPVVYVSGASAEHWPARGVPGSLMLAKPFAIAQLVVAVSTATLGPAKDLPTQL